TGDGRRVLGQRRAQGEAGRRQGRGQRRHAMPPGAVAARSSRRKTAGWPALGPSGSGPAWVSTKPAFSSTWRERALAASARERRAVAPAARAAATTASAASVAKPCP